MGGIEFVRDGKKIAFVDFVEPNLNLLAHAQTIELETGSSCGGHGICGGDRIRVTSASLSPMTEQERELLSESELAAGIRLACQCFPNSSEPSLRIELLG